MPVVLWVSVHGQLVIVRVVALDVLVSNAFRTHQVVLSQFRQLTEVAV